MASVYTVNKQIYDISLGSLEIPYLTEITPGERANSLIFHFKIGHDAFEYTISNVGVTIIGLRCDSRTLKCKTSVSLLLLKPELVIAIGKKANGRNKYGFNRDLEMEIRCTANYKVIEKVDRKPHVEKCIAGRSTESVQMRPAKRVFRALSKEAGIKAGEAVIETVITQIGLYEQVRNHGTGVIVNTSNEIKAVNQQIKRNKGPVIKGEVPLSAQTVDTTQFPYRTFVDEQFYWKISDGIHLFVLQSELKWLNKEKWFADGTWTCTMDIKFIQTYIITIK